MKLNFIGRTQTKTKYQLVIIKVSCIVMLIFTLLLFAYTNNIIKSKILSFSFTNISHIKIIVSKTKIKLFYLTKSTSEHKSCIKWIFRTLYYKFNFYKYNRNPCNLTHFIWKPDISEGQPIWFFVIDYGKWL